MYVPDQERERLRRLYALNILDTPPEKAFDNIVTLAAELLEMPIALVSLIDQERIWFKARVGLEATQTNCGMSLCRYALHSNGPLIIHDARLDPRFSNSPMVTGAPHIRFYASVPIRPDGRYIMGTLSVVDTHPRRISMQQQRHLEILAEQVAELFRLRQQAISVQPSIESGGRNTSGALLDILNNGLTDAHALESGSRLWHFLKFTLLRLTDSKHALIGEVNTHLNGQPYLKIHAASDNNPTAVFRFNPKKPCQHAQKRPSSCFLEQVFIEGRTVICNTLDNNTPCHGCLPNTPTMQNYLGVPIIDQGEIIGMFAIANSPRPYDMALVEWLASFRSTCALLIRLYRQLNERDCITLQLRQARDEAERANLAKNEFLSSMSHELRTPLNAILGFSQLLLASTNQPLLARQRRQVEQIQRSGQHLMELISEILDLSCIESGHIKLNIEPVQVGFILEEAITTLTPFASQMNISIKIEDNSPLKTKLLADTVKLQQIFINLISNAIKYNKPNGGVLISIQLQEHKARINVIDSGIGIAAENITQLFQPFTRVGIENTAIEGTGVGLALTRKLLEHMNGNIGVDSLEGIGSTFWFELPLAPDAPQTLSATREETSLFEYTWVGKTTPINVLCVEDSLANQELLKDLFSERPEFHVHYAATANKGLEIARNSLMDVILMDINLPDMNGRQARALLARCPTTRHIPIVAMSASAMPDDIQQGVEAGFAAYLTKPLNLNQLLHVLHTVVNRECSP